MKCKIRYNKKTKEWDLLTGDDMGTYSSHDTRKKAEKALKKEIEFWQRSDEGEKIINDLLSRMSKLHDLIEKYYTAVDLLSDFEESETTEKQHKIFLKRSDLLAVRIGVAIEVLQKRLPPWSKRKPSVLK